MPMQLNHIAILLYIFSLPVFAGSNEKDCLDFVSRGDNYKIAYKNARCISAAENGSGPAMYSIGMSYGFSGQAEAEKMYYLLAAEKNVPAAYLALGHIYRSSNEKKAISWYKRYFNSKAEGYGYGAKILSEIYLSHGNNEQAEHWLSLCAASPMGSKCAK